MRSVRCDASTKLLGLLLVGAAALGSGCNNGRQLQADLYQRELRLQEDEIYRLEDYVEEYQAIIRGYRCEVSDLKRQLASSDSAATSSQSTQAESPSSGQKFRKPTPAPTAAPTEEEAPRFGLPKLDSLPEPPVVPESAPADPTEEAPPFVPLSVRSDAPPLPAPPVPEARDATLPREPQPLLLATAEQSEGVSEPMTLLPLETVAPTTEGLQLKLRKGAAEPDGTPTLLVTVTHGTLERSSNPLEGEWSLMLTDPTTSGKRKRIARWDYTDEEILAASREPVATESSFELQVRLPRETPTDRPLRFWVRHVTPAGEKVLAWVDAEFMARPLRLVHAYDPVPPLAR